LNSLIIELPQTLLQGRSIPEIARDARGH